MPGTLSKETRVDLIRCYHETRSIVGALRKYRTEKKLKAGPCSEQALGRLVKRFQKTGSTADGKSSGRPTVSEIEVAEILNMSTELSNENQLQTSSAREIARRLGQPVATVRKVMRKSLGLHPYHLKNVHQLLPGGDFEIRLDFGLK